MYPKYNHRTFWAFPILSERPLSRKHCVIVLSAFVLDLFGFKRYTCSLGAAGALSFYDPLEGTETRYKQMRLFGAQPLLAVHLLLGSLLTCE